MMLCAVLFSALAAPQQAAVKPVLTFQAMRRIDNVYDPQISPGGSHVVYVRSSTNWKADRYDTELVLVSVATGAQHVLTEDRRATGSPRWSPDGTRIAFLASPGEKKPQQVFVLRLDGGDAVQITHSKTGVEAYAWRPDGRAIAYAAADEPPNAKAIAHHLDGVTITDENYLTEKQPQPIHLWLVDTDGSDQDRLNSGSWSIAPNSQLEWSPDGTRIYYQRQPDAVFAHWVDETTYAYDVASKRNVSLGLGPETAPAISSDGSSIAFSAPRHGSPYLQNDLLARSLGSGRERFSSLGIDRNVHGKAWLPRGRVLIETPDGVRNVFWILGPQGEGTRLDIGQIDPTPDFSVARNGAIAFIGMLPDRPGDVYVLEPGASAPKRLSDWNAWMSAYAIPRVREIASPTDMGITAYDDLYYPPDYVVGRTYPLVLVIHGGPIETSTRDFNTGLFGYADQILAAHGYLVLQPNYRGSDNEGDRFTEGIVGDMASGPGRDNLAAVATVEKLGIVDSSRIGVSGWSAGGLATSWLIGHSTIWRAAVSGAAVNDQFEQAMLSDINLPFNDAFFPGVNPFTKAGRAAYWAQSPIAYASDVRTPTLILSDTRDPRVPVPQSYAFYHALRAEHVPVEFVALPRYGHFPEDPVGREEVFRHWAGWFQRWFKR
jgi:dipeptidyl aminopeptidase/acylaminoacyl peptidase